MTLRRLTDFAVHNAKPKDKGYEISDGRSGLRLAVHPSGAKSWVVRYRHPVTRVSRKLTLLPPEKLTLAQARKLAGDAMFSVSQGVDPIEAKRAEKQDAVAATEGTLASVAARYLDIEARKLRSHKHYESVLARHVLPKLGQRQVGELRRSEIVSVLDTVEQTAGPRAADAALAVLRACLRWHEMRSDTFRSPVVPGMQRVKASQGTRDRILDDDELRAVWKATFDERLGPYGACVRLLLLTGARRSEVAGLRRSEIVSVREDGSDIVVWRLPAIRSKSKSEIVRPLSKAALDIVDSTPVISDSDYVFTLNGINAMSLNYVQKKQLIDEIAGVQGWVVHDLRRTYRSLLSRCRVAFEVAERLLGHSRPLLDKVYDRHAHMAAMLEGTNKVAAEVERIVTGERMGKLIRL
jgi:integrase